MPQIVLRQGLIFELDDVDADLVPFTWWLSRSSDHHTYCQRQAPCGPTRKLSLHREIGERIHGAPIPKGYVVDHIDGDTLNNRRANLRVVTHTQNTWNQLRPCRNSKSGIIGVRQHRARWQAYICRGAKMHVLGTFDTSDEAAAARRNAEAERALAER